MTPIEPPATAPIVHYDTTKKPPVPQRPYANSNLLSPDAAFLAQPPPFRQQGPGGDHSSQEDRDTVDGDTLSLGRVSKRSRRRRKGGGRRRGRAVWKKLLWVKQKDYPDNYTDQTSFLSHLEWNPRFRPYDFWPLVADSTVIVQHISSIVIFICSFVGIYQQRLSPVHVVSWGTTATALGWICWDVWTGRASSAERSADRSGDRINTNGSYMNGGTHSGNLDSSIGSKVPTPFAMSTRSSSAIGLGLSLSSVNLAQTANGKKHTHSMSQGSHSSGGPSPTLSHRPSHVALEEHIHANPPLFDYTQQDRLHQRLSTAKSAILIYTALLGLSPILKSLTKSTSSDSIWALSTGLMLLHIFFFDYGISSPSSSSSSAKPITREPSASSNGAGGAEAGAGLGSSKFPASLSTNAALMASTVLASRLPSTTHVFSLTLFSIEVFGLFPVWRRFLRHSSWRGHLILTLCLVLGAGAGLGLVITGRRIWTQGGWKRAIAGAIVWTLGSVVCMGGCSWWLITLQRYKNVVSGPWDPARPIIRGGAATWH